MVNLTQHIQLLITSLKSEIVSSPCNDHSAVQVDILSWIHQRKVVKANRVFCDPSEDPLYCNQECLGLPISLTESQ